MSNERKSRRIDERERRPEPRAGGLGDFPVGDATTGADDANEGGAAGSIAPMTRGATAPGVDGAKPEASPGMSEIFYKSLFASRAPSFELHPDRLFHGVGHFGPADQEAGRSSEGKPCRNCRISQVQVVDSGAKPLGGHPPV